MRTSNPNPILVSSREHTVGFADGAKVDYSDSIITESMYTQYDIDGNQYLILYAIVDYKNDKIVVAIVNMYQLIKGRQHLRKTTKD